MAGDRRELGDGVSAARASFQRRAEKNFAGCSYKRLRFPAALPRFFLREKGVFPESQVVTLWTKKNRKVICSAVWI